MFYLHKVKKTIENLNMINWDWMDGNDLKKITHKKNVYFIYMYTTESWYKLCSWYVCFLLRKSCNTGNEAETALLVWTLGTFININVMQYMLNYGTVHTCNVKLITIQVRQTYWSLQYICMYVINILHHRAWGLY